MSTIYKCFPYTDIQTTTSHTNAWVQNHFLPYAFLASYVSFKKKNQAANIIRWNLAEVGLMNKIKPPKSFLYIDDAVHTRLIDNKEVKINKTKKV